MVLPMGMLRLGRAQLRRQVRAVGKTATAYIARIVVFAPARSVKKGASARWMRGYQDFSRFHVPTIVAVLSRNARPSISRAR